VLDVGFTELLLVAVIGLILIGPERLPETVRTIALYVGRFKRTLRETRREIEVQLGADEIRRELHNEEVMRSLEKLRSDVQADIDESLDFEKDLYPPGHHDHDPNNDVDEGEPWRPEQDNSIAANQDTALNQEIAADQADTEPSQQDPNKTE